MSVDVILRCSQLSHKRTPSGTGKGLRCPLVELPAQPRSQGPLLPVPWSERGDGKERTLGTRLLPAYENYSHKRTPRKIRVDCTLIPRVDRIFFTQITHNTCAKGDPALGKLPRYISGRLRLTIAFFETPEFA